MVCFYKLILVITKETKTTLTFRNSTFNTHLIVSYDMTNFATLAEKITRLNITGLFNDLQGLNLVLCMFVPLPIQIAFSS